MRAIETVYGGYRFRSRLEARWAVFFDRCGVKWEYEPEGFVLDNGECYLPDFRLSYTDGRPDVWVEIKPNAEPPDDALIKLWYLSSEDKTAVLFSGDPFDIYVKHSGAVFTPAREDSNPGIMAFETSAKSYWLLGIVSLLSRDKELEISAKEETDFPSCLLSMILPIIKAQKSAEASRSARFEHGEDGHGRV